MAAAGGSEAAAAAGGKRGPLGIPEAAFVVSGAGERGWAALGRGSWGRVRAAGLGIPEAAFMRCGAEGWGLRSASRARPREAAPPPAGGTRG